MDNFLQTIRQMQLSISLASAENKELRDQVIALQAKYDPEKDLKIDNLEKTIVIQQQQIASLKLQSLTNTAMKDQKNDDDCFKIEQLNLQVNERCKESQKQQEQIYQSSQHLRNCQSEISDLKQTLSEQQQQYKQLQSKASSMETLLKKVKGQGPLSLSYITEIDRLTVKLQQLESQFPTIQSRLTYQSYLQ